MSIYHKLVSSFSYSAVNFLLSIVGVLVTLHYISIDDWVSLGLIFALLPVTSNLTFFMKHQSILVEKKEDATHFISDTVRKIKFLLFFSFPMICVIYYFALTDSFVLIFLSTLFSVLLGFRVVQKYALTISSFPRELYMSNIISLVIWISCFLIFGLFIELDSFFRILFNIIGEFFAYLYINFLFYRKQEKIPDRVIKNNMKTRVVTNFIRVLIRQINYNLPVYIVNYFLSNSLSSQIAQLFRVRVVVDQITHTFMVTLSKKIIDLNIRSIFYYWAVSLLPCALVFLSGAYLLSFFKSYAFDLAFIFWLTLIVCIWLLSTLLTLKMEIQNKISNLIFLEILMFIFICTSFFIILYGNII